MKRAFFPILIVLLLFPIGTSYSQTQDRPPTLGIELTSFTPFHYKDDDGHTIIIGEVINTKNFPVTGVKIWAGFYDDVNLQPLESTVGASILEVIPPNGIVPYMIKSPSPNSSITNVSVNLLGFNSAGAKQQELLIESGSVESGEQLIFSGSIENTSGSIAQNTKIFLVLYDAFEPPRLLRIFTQEITEPIPSGSTISFEFNEKRVEQAVGFKVFAESSNFSSNEIDQEILPPEIISKLVTINDISITDNLGNKLADATANTPINIQSNVWLQYFADSELTEQPFVYYTQVKQSGEKAFVEFIGKYESKFDSAGPQDATVEWTPEKPGLYFIETFVWDPNFVPLASKGPVILVLVN